MLHFLVLAIFRNKKTKIATMRPRHFLGCHHLYKNLSSKYDKFNPFFFLWKIWQLKKAFSSKNSFGQVISPIVFFVFGVGMGTVAVAAARQTIGNVF